MLGHYSHYIFDYQRCDDHRTLSKYHRILKEEIE